MAYIGLEPSNSFVSLKRQVITGDGTASYTLDHSVASVNDVAIFVNNVRQDPAGYSISGAALTLGGTIESSDDCYVIFLGQALQTVTPDSDTITTAMLKSNAVTSAKLTYPLTTFSSTGIDDNADATAITINSSEQVGIGETAPLGKLHVKSGDSGVSSPDITELVVECSGSGSGGISLLGATNGQVEIAFGDSGDANIGRFAYNHDSNFLATVVNASERMRIASNGDAYFNKTSDSFSTTGVGILNTSQVQFVASNQGLLYCNRLNSDGQLAIFFQDGTEEGAISVSGSTVTYAGFTGTHWSRFTDNSTPTILRGTVLETLDEMCDWYNLEFDITDEEGNINTKKIPHVLLDSQSDGDTVTYNHNGTDYEATIVKETDIKHMMSKVSDTTDAKNVYGLFVAYDLDGEGYNDFYVASAGSYVVRIKQGETIAKGDLLQSNGDGTAKVQTDDNIKSSSFAKVLSTTKIETYEDGSFIVPCSLMC